VVDNLYYEVRNIKSGVIVYRGRSFGSAASKLDVGTCYGKGPTPHDASEHAKSEVRKFRESNTNAPQRKQLQNVKQPTSRADEKEKRPEHSRGSNG